MNVDRRFVEMRAKTERVEADSVVYFIERDGLIKIGTTHELEKRLRRLQPSTLLATERGWTAREAQLHRQFVHLRLTPRGEWFRDAPELRAYIASLGGAQ